MTREEAKKLFWKKGGVFEKTFIYCLDKVLKLPYRGGEIDVFIDKIYNDFESRVCGNCEHFNSPYETCRLGCASCATTKKVREDFGCNKFKRKKDENI